MRRLRLGLPLALALLALTALTTTLAWGPVYSAGVLAILGAHEMGHWLMCRRHRVASSYPLFVPFPLGFLPLLGVLPEHEGQLWGFGTMGALILIRSRFPDRRALFDIGAAGPIAGVLVALPLTLYGLARSPVVSGVPEGTLVLGDSLLFRAFVQAAVGTLPPGADVTLHPLALAGWFGLLVTGLNLLPLGQLDGGHVAYALLGRRGARWASRATLAGFTLVTLFVYNYWILFLALVSILAWRHPAPLEDATPLGPGRRLLGWATLALFVLTFIPAPLGGVPALWGTGR